MIHGLFITLYLLSTALMYVHKVRLPLPLACISLTRAVLGRGGTVI